MSPQRHQPKYRNDCFLKKSCGSPAGEVSSPSGHQEDETLSKNTIVLGSIPSIAIQVCGFDFFPPDSLALLSSKSSQQRCGDAHTCSAESQYESFLLLTFHLSFQVVFLKMGILKRRGWSLETKKRLDDYLPGFLHCFHHGRKLYSIDISRKEFDFFGRNLCFYRKKKDGEGPKNSGAIEVESKIRGPDVISAIFRQPS